MLRSVTTEKLNVSAGPVMTKFTIALREIGTYKEVLRSKVENLVLYLFNMHAQWFLVFGIPIKLQKFCYDMSSS